MRSVWYFPAQFLRWKRRFYDFVVSEATWWNQTSGCSAAMGYLFSSETTGRGWGSADHKSVEFRQHVSRFVLSRVNRRVSIASSLPLKKDSTLPIYSLITCQDRFIYEFIIHLVILQLALCSVANARRRISTHRFGAYPTWIRNRWWSWPCWLRRCTYPKAPKIVGVVVGALGRYGRYVTFFMSMKSLSVVKQLHACFEPFDDDLPLEKAELHFNDMLANCLRILLYMIVFLLWTLDICKLSSATGWALECA